MNFVKELRQLQNERVSLGHYGTAIYALKNKLDRLIELLIAQAEMAEISAKVESGEE